MKRLFFIVCMFLATCSFAKKWDATYISKLIANGGIDKVIQYYQDKYYGENRDPQDAFKIAELYVKKKEYATAMQWYDKEKQLLNSSKVNLFNYANTNRLMGEYQKALDGYLMYAANTGDVAKVMDLANQCEKILKLSSQSTNYKLDNYTYNTADDETNVALLRTNAVYNTITKSKDEKQTYTINQIVRDFENFAEPVKAYRNNIPKITITSISYSKDGNSVVFSAKDEKASSKKSTKNNEKIYIADNLGGNFLNAKLVSFNEEAYSFKNPSFNDDGTTIYFSSNRTGGFGGFDIWKSTLDKGKWSTPINLGKLVNTKSDEINPFLVQDGNENTLFFSSDRDGGFGGFDIYTVKKSSNIWQDAEMQPAPINSAGDDISIVYDNEVKTGYFSSNRLNGKGGFDIYRFTPFSLRIIINAVDSSTGKSLDYAYVQLNENGQKALEGVTNENGKATFQVGKDRTFRINISKDNYRPIVVDANSIGKANGDSVEVNVILKQDAQFNVLKGATNAMSMQNYIIFTGHVIDNATNKPAVNAKMRMVNYATQKVRELDLDKDGKFEIKLLLNNNYKIIFENQSSKIIDELTTYGLEKNDVKIRDYVLTGTKLKLTENKVYKNGNLPENIKVNTTSNANTISTSTNEPITQAKIDSLMKVVSKDNAKLQKINKTAETPAPTKTEITEEKPKETQLIVVGPKDEVAKPTTAILAPKVENETPLLAADIAPTTKNKKVKIIKEEAEEVETKVEEVVAEIPKPIVADAPSKTVETPNSPSIVEMPKEIAVEKTVLAKDKTETIIENKTETPKETIVAEIPKSAKEVSENSVSNLGIKENNTEKKLSDATVATPTTTIKEKINTPSSLDELPDVYYKIQLASYNENNIQFPEFDNIGKVEIVKAYDRYIYRLGNFIELERAKQILEQVRAQGYFVAFILQYNKDKVTGIVK